MFCCLINSFDSLFVLILQMPLASLKTSQCFNFIMWNEWGTYKANILVYPLNVHMNYEIVRKYLFIPVRL